MDRRSFLGMGLAGAAGTAAGASGGLAWGALRDAREKGAAGRAVVPFYGIHQSGIETPLQEHGTLVAFTLNAEQDAGATARLLRLWSVDAALLQSGQPTMGDATPHLAAVPASLTITIGLGRGAFVASGIEDQWPMPVVDIPAYPTIDKLEPRWSGGDLVLQVCANDALTVSHTVRELIKDAKPFATVAWVQTGTMPVSHIIGSETPRNHMGFKDGTGNPLPGTDIFAKTVWNTGADQPWFEHGSTMAIRRIRMDLDLWDQLLPEDQERAFGRYADSGAPLGGTHEFQLPDLVARDAKGEPVIPSNAHIRRAILDLDIYRRVFNYDESPSDRGLLFIAYGAELTQYLEIQQSLAEQDALNKWTTPIGSAVFAMLPGAPDATSWVGEPLFS